MYIKKLRKVMQFNQRYKKQGLWFKIEDFELITDTNYPLQTTRQKKYWFRVKTNYAVEYVLVNCF